MAVLLDDFFMRRTRLPVVDVRSENEFLQGHIPGAINIPLLNNAERVQVGTDYKQKGPSQAIKTGFRLVGPRLAEIIAATEQVAAGGEILVHCWRGGMRSNFFCQFVGMAQIKAVPLAGGYKAYRQRAMELFQRPLQLITLGGCTGSGKTELLAKLAEAGEQVIDLEALARHKGSVFGGLMQPPQPTTEQFHNYLFEQLFRINPARPVWVEDESIAIGHVFLPGDFWDQLNQSPIVEIVLPKPQRVQRLVAEYGLADRDEFIAAIQKISKRLGGLAQQEAVKFVLAGNMSAAIEILLSYYDRAYEFGLAKKMEVGRIRHRVAWNGENSKGAVQELLRYSREFRAAGA